MVPCWAQIEAPLSFCAESSPEALAHQKALAVEIIDPGEQQPLPASRDCVQVVLRDSRSTSPDCKAVKRSFEDKGMNLTLSGSSKIAAATARQ